jgi:hypothetical protein
MKTVYARYEVGVEGESLEYFRLLSDASMLASSIGGYVYDRMARVGKPQLWQSINGDLIVKSVRLPKIACTGCKASRRSVKSKSVVALRQ